VKILEKASPAEGRGVREKKRDAVGKTPSGKVEPARKANKESTSTRPSLSFSSRGGKTHELAAQGTLF